MKDCDITWSDEYLCGYAEIDLAHKEIIEKACALNKMIAHPDHHEATMLKLADKLMEILLKHMDCEIMLLKKLSIKWQDHKESHNEYINKFDLKKGHSMSNMMRVLLAAEVVREYIKHHFCEFDIPDMQKIAQKLKK